MEQRQEEALLRRTELLAESSRCSLGEDSPDTPSIKAEWGKQVLSLIANERAEQIAQSTAHMARLAPLRFHLTHRRALFLLCSDAPLPFPFFPFIPSAAAPLNPLLP